MVKSKLTQLDFNGKFVDKPMSVFLQTECCAPDSLIIKIASRRKGLPSNIKFGEGEEADKLFVNPFPITGRSETDSAQDQVYHYHLHNRQSVKITFSEFSIKALSIPIKVRFGKADLAFSTDANLGVLAGYTWGVTRFTHRRKIGNMEMEQKKTIGVILGTENLVFEFENEDRILVEESSALISAGLGFIYSYEKFAMGLTGGFGYALGENKSKWDYHTRPWLGLAIGYSLFTF